MSDGLLGLGRMMIESSCPSLWTSSVPLKKRPVTVSRVRSSSGSEATDGYADNVCEINAFEVFTGVILNSKVVTKTNYE